MIERKFWEEVRSYWILEAPPQISDRKTSSGGEIDPSLLEDPWGQEGIPFDMVDYDDAMEPALTGESYQVPKGQGQKPKVAPRQGIQPMPQSFAQAVKPLEKRQKPMFDSAGFEERMERRTLTDYIEAGKLLLKCELPEKMEKLGQELLDRMSVLQTSIREFEKVYQPDMSQFYDCYIPDTLQLAASYLEYVDAEIDGDIIKETEKEAAAALETLINGVNEKIEEIYRYEKIEIHAQARALESMMSQDGYVDPNFKIR